MKRIWTVGLVLLAAALALSAQEWGRQTWAQDKLNQSPRHHEWVSVQHDGRTVAAYITYPEA